MGCLRSAQYNMRATLVRSAPRSEDNEAGGWHWEMVQDPDSGALVPVRVEDDVTTPEVDESVEGLVDFDLSARGVIDGGIRVAGTTETFDQVYRATDWVKIKFAPHVPVSRADKVTNVRKYDGGPVIWVEEESGNIPTVFKVMGVTPVLDPFGNHIENFAMLQRAETSAEG